MKTDCDFSSLYHIINMIFTASIEFILVGAFVFAVLTIIYIESECTDCRFCRNILKEILVRPSFEKRKCDGRSVKGSKT